MFQKMVLTPSRTNTSPTVTLTAAALTHGSIMQMKPATISRMPTARTQPQLILFPQKGKKLAVQETI